MHRDTLQWVAALDLMLDLNPELLVPQHTRPLAGRENIKETMTAYRYPCMISPLSIYDRLSPLYIQFLEVDHHIDHSETRYSSCTTRQ